MRDYKALLERTRILQRYWATIPEENVDLACFVDENPTYKATCDTVACIGGWVPYIPEFIAMGAGHSDTGLPVLQTKKKTLFGSDVASYLFGEPTLFATRSGCDYDLNDVGLEKDGSDHRIASIRLRKHVAYLRKCIAQDEKLYAREEASA